MTLNKGVVMKIINETKERAIVLKNNRVEIYVNQENILDIDMFHLHAILNKLSEDKNVFVRMRAASNKYATINVLEKLSIDQSFSVRYAVALNLNTPKHILENLIKSDEEAIKLAAKRMLCKRMR